MIFYNGETGSLGRYFAEAAAAAGAASCSLRARLEDRDGLVRELDGHAGGVRRASKLWLVQMAALVSVPACERDPAAAHKTNVVDTLATVDDFVRWARGLGARPHVLYVSSGHVYAEQVQGQRLTESAPVAPRSHYARSKLAAEHALAADAAKESYPLLIARVFGLIAPRQPAHYMLQGLIRRARERDVSAIPGLDFHRDMLDARDVCRLLVALCACEFAEHDRAAECFNVCSGVAVQLREIIGQLLQLLHPAEAAALLAKLSAADGRADDIAWIVGDPSALERLLGAPAQRIGLAQTLADAVAAAANDAG